MAITGITTVLTDTALGNTVPSDGICMLFCGAVAATGTGGLNFELNTAYLITSLQQAADYGIDPEVEQNANLYFQISEFFQRSGNGAKLWIYGIDFTTTKWNAFIPSAAFESAIRSTTAVDYDNRPRIIAISGDDGTALTATSGIIPDYTVTVLGLLQTSLASMFQKSYRMVGIMDVFAIDCAAATGLMTEAVATTLPNAAEYNAPRIALLITTSTPGMQASVGEAMGTLSRATISVSPGAVSTIGPIRQRAYFMDRFNNTWVNTPVNDPPQTTIDDIASKQYFFLRARITRPGVYYNDGATCNAKTNALSTISFVRVGNAVCDSAEQYFEGLIQEFIPTNPANGSIENSFKSATLADLDSIHMQPRIDRGEAQVIEVDFWAHDGNYNESKAIDIQVSILGNTPLERAYIETFFVSQTGSL